MLKSVKNNKILWIFLAFVFSLRLQAEVQGTITDTCTLPAVGSSTSSCSISSTIGGSSTLSYTRNYLWGGIHEIVPDGVTATGAFSSITSSNVRYGITFDTFELFESPTDANQWSIASTGTSCPSSNTYNWLLVRVRTADLSPSNPSNNSPMYFNSSSQYVGGTMSYASSTFTGVDYLNLETFTKVNSSSSGWEAYGYSGFNSATCSSGNYKVEATNLSFLPIDQYGYLYFGNNTFMQLSSGGNPVAVIGVPQQNVTNSVMSNLTDDVLTGFYTFYEGWGTQDQRTVYVVPNQSNFSGPYEFDVYQSSTNLNGGSPTTTALTSTTQNPTGQTALATIKCNTLNSPTEGFCSGTVTMSGVSGQGNIVCEFYTGNSGHLMACTGQYPGNNNFAVSFVAQTPASTTLSVGLSSSGYSQISASTASGSLTATVTNLTGRTISSMGSPATLGTGSNLATPFTEPTYSGSAYYSGTGTCGTSLPGFGSCTLPVVYAPSGDNVATATFRVGYNTGTTSISGCTSSSGFYLCNATAYLTGSRGLSSVAVTPASANYTNGSSQQFTATASFTDAGTPQTITSLVTWSSTATGVATSTSSGNVSYVAVGTSTIDATLAGSVVGSTSVTVTAPNVTSLAATPNSASQITLSWASGGTGTTGYQLSYKSGATAPTDCSTTGTGITIVSASTINGATSYAITSLSQSTGYSFRVCANDSQSVLSSGQTVSATTQTPQVFVTSNAYYANFGSIYVADLACQIEGSNAGLSGVWKAIVSDSTHPASTRLTQSGFTYYNTASTPQAVSSGTPATIWSGTLANGIGSTATGSTITTKIWTGCNGTGGYSTNDTCSDWTSNSSSGNGAFGFSNTGTNNWLDDTNMNCSNTGHFYCINNQTASAAPNELASLSSSTNVGQVILNWTSGGGTTAGYMISYQTGSVAPTCNTATTVMPATIGATTLFYAVSGLTNGTQYSFRVCATNSDWSSLSTGLTATVTVASGASTDTAQTVFVSSNAYAATFGSIYVADYACQMEASNAGYTGIWKAIISDSANNASTRLTYQPYLYNAASSPQLVATTDSEISTTTTGFFGGSLVNAVLYSATGSSLSTNVWTGTTTSGLYSSGNTCSDWTSTSGNAAFGQTSANGEGNWIDDTSTACSGTLHFYCLNGQTASAAPNEVASISASGTGSSMTLSWTSGGGTTAAYKIAYQSGATAPSTCALGTPISASTIGAATLSHTITGLTAGTTYSYRVCAQNSDLSLTSTGITKSHTQ